MSLLFSKIPKNCQNQSFFEGTVMGRRIFTIKWARILRNLSEICLSKKCVYYLYCPQLELFPRQGWTKIDCPTLVARWNPICTKSVIFRPLVFKYHSCKCYLHLKNGENFQVFKMCTFNVYLIYRLQLGSGSYRGPPPHEPGG